MIKGRDFFFFFGRVLGRAESRGGATINCMIAINSPACYSWPYWPRFAPHPSSAPAAARRPAGRAAAGTSRSSRPACFSFSAPPDLFFLFVVTTTRHYWAVLPASRINRPPGGGRWLAAFFSSLLRRATTNKPQIILLPTPLRQKLVIYLFVWKKTKQQCLARYDYDYSIGHDQKNCPPHVLEVTVIAKWFFRYILWSIKNLFLTNDPDSETTHFQELLDSVAKI